MRFFKPWLFSLKSIGFCWDVSIRALAMAIPADNTQQSKPRVREEKHRLTERIQKQKWFIYMSKQSYLKKEQW